MASRLMAIINTATASLLTENRHVHATISCRLELPFSAAHTLLYVCSGPGSAGDEKATVELLPRWKADEKLVFDFVKTRETSQGGKPAEDDAFDPDRDRGAQS